MLVNVCARVSFAVSVAIACAHHDLRQSRSHGKFTRWFIINFCLQSFTLCLALCSNALARGESSVAVSNHHIMRSMRSMRSKTIRWKWIEIAVRTLAATVTVATAFVRLHSINGNDYVVSRLLYMHSILTKSIASTQGRTVLNSVSGGIAAVRRLHR